MERRHIPDDVMFNMLLPRLPAKSLVRFKSVCKAWHSFLNSYSDNHTRLIFSDHHHIRSLLGKATKTKTLKFPYRIELHKLIGSCNGLLCILVQKDRPAREAYLLLWNPWTGRYNKISISKINVYQVIAGYSFSNSFGFGYDHSTDDYKIVRFITFKRTTQFDIYSLKNNSWKTETLPWNLWMVYACLYPGTFVNGALYWRIDDVDEKAYVHSGEILNGGSQAILHLNLVNHKFCLILPPEDVGMKAQFDLCDFGGCLCMVHYNRSNQRAASGHIDIWTRKEQNWVKSMSIPRLQGLDLRLYLTPVFFYETGEVLMHLKDVYYSRGKGQFYLYFPKQNIFKKHMIDSSMKKSHEEITYTRSLASLPRHRFRVTQSNNEIEKKKVTRKKQDDE